MNAKPRDLEAKPTRRVMVSRRALIHAVATCIECSWHCQDYRRAMSLARQHTVDTGHRVSVESGYIVTVAPDAKREGAA